MNKTIFLQHIDDILERSHGTTKEDEILNNIASWDSLAVLSFITFVDQNFGAVLSPVDIYNARTVNDLMILLSVNITT